MKEELISENTHQSYLHNNEGDIEIKEETTEKKSSNTSSQKSFFDTFDENQ